MRDYFLSLKSAPALLISLSIFFNLESFLDNLLFHSSLKDCIEGN